MQRHIIYYIKAKDNYKCECGWEGRVNNIAQHMVHKQFVVEGK